MKILLVYPEFLVTFWSWKHLLKFVSKKAAFPPLGLLTVAAMLPRSWEVRLVDVNATKLTDEDIRWANYVFISAITTQKDSAERVISRCNKIKTPVVLGGPILEMGYEFKGVRSFLRGEVEETLLDFLADLKSSGLEREYSQRGFPDLALSPIPLWELINCKDYACMLVQYGRGCPYKCTFCNVAALNGRTPRAKSPEKFLEELEAIYKTGFRGPIMFADDNFIGNKSRVKEMLPLLARWQRDHKYPFDFTVEVDITIAGDSELMTMMVLAGFKKVFLGLETPNYDALVECHKFQNTKCDMEASIRILQNHGLHPMSGFIIGFDSDGPDIFDKHIDFYQRTGIVFPMVGAVSYTHLRAPRD